MLLLMALFGCGGGPGDAGDAAFTDTSYPYYTVLEEVGARCDDATETLVLTARTVGWSECGSAHAYVPGNPAGLDGVDVRLITEFARQDESCDYLRGSVPVSELGLDSCAALRDAPLWLGFEVTFEEGCAGCARSDQASPEVLAEHANSDCGSACDPETCFLDGSALAVVFGDDAAPCEDNPEPRRD